MSYETYQFLIYVWIAAGVATFILLQKVTAPYGRHTTSGWGPQINNNLGWIIMEAPVMILSLYFYLSSIENQTAVSSFLTATFVLHYINRTFIFPFRLRTKGKKMPLVIVGSAIFFNLVNGCSLGYYFAHFAVLDNSHFLKWYFILGSLLFIGGVYINWKSDNILIHLRKPGETGYAIPNGFLFNYLSCPNLFGEIIEWVGFALMCWNLPAVSFLVWSCANLIPRAQSHHKWYLQKFANYPANRKAIFPFLI